MPLGVRDVLFGPDVCAVCIVDVLQVEVIGGIFIEECGVPCYCVFG